MRLTKRTNQIIAIVLSFLIISGYLPLEGAAAAAQPSANDDLQGHWAADEVHKWAEEGFISGFTDGTFRPNQGVTRAELTKLINALFGFTDQAAASFNDIANDAWYKDQVAIAKEAGYISGYPDGSFKPNETVTRQEVAKMAAALFPLPTAADNTLSVYKDQSSISGFAKSAMANMVGGGFLKGFTDGTIRPAQPITRAEAVVLLDRLAGDVEHEAGTVKDINAKGNMLVTTQDVKLVKPQIGGNLILTAGIGEGDSHIEGGSVAGAVYVNGGGVNSIHIKGTKVKQLTVNKKKPVRVVISEDANIEQLNVETKAIIELEKNAIAGKIVVSAGAKGTEIKVQGTIRDLIIEADGVTVNGQAVTKGSKVSIVDGRIVTEPTTPGSGNTGSNPGTNPGTDPGTNPGTDPGTNPGTDPGTNPGTDPGTNPGTDPGTNPGTDPDEWELVWDDEFDRSGTNLDTNGVDLDKWGYQEGTGAQYGLDGWGNKEKQSYSKNNIKVENGKLVIEARKETANGVPYTSGRLYTEPTFNKTYGKFEAKIKMPEGDGIWPAFWMVPTNSEYGVWASSGELDIMEARGRLPQEVAGTIHFGKKWPNNKAEGGDYHFENGESITGEHVYGVEWEPGEIRWYVDGKLYSRLNKWDSTGENQPAKYAYPAPFDKDFYMILNLAVGGTFDGDRIPPDSKIPAKMEVDYVRVYDKVGGYENPSAEPTVESEPLPAVHKEAINGSYVYDPSFTQPFTLLKVQDDVLNPTYWNFATISTFSGAGTVSTETLDTTPFAKVDITSGGGAAHAVQMIQNVTLGKGRWYKLSFDAKAASSRTMLVKFGGGADRGWTSYSDSLEAGLTDQLQSYEMTFQMKADTDTQARLEFNMGLNTKSIWLGNVKLVEVDAMDLYKEDEAKDPLVGGNHVYNGTFDLGRIDRMTYWHWATNGATATASVDADGRQLLATISNGGAAADSVSLVQKGINLVQGNDYRITFKAKAEVARTIAVGVQKEDGTAVEQPETVALTTAWETHTVNFSTQDGDSDLNGKLLFLLGGQAGDVTLDDIVMVRLTNHNMGELPLADQFPVKNGDFSNGKLNWSEHVQGRFDGWGSSAVFTANQGELKIAVANEGNNPWDVMLMQTDFNLFRTNTYVVSLDARSTVARQAELVVDSSNTRYVSQTLNLTPTMQTFTYELPVDADMTASFKLLLGKLQNAAAIGAHDVYVDNVRVELKGARDHAFLVHNGDFSAGWNSWSKHLQGDYDGDSRATITTDIGAYHADITNNGANPWDIMLYQEPLALEKGKTYTVTFNARSTKPRKIEAVVENSTNFRYLNQAVQLDDSTNTYSYTFTMDKNDTTGLKFLMGKLSGDSVVGAHDIYIDNVRFEVQGALEATGERVSEQDNIHLPNPPALSPDATNNLIGQPQTISFADKMIWRTAISSISIDGNVVSPQSYSIAPGSITLDASLFPTAQNYEIVVKSTGYEKATVVQQVEASSDWSLIWNDEFDGTGSNLDTNGVDLDKWGYQQGNGSEYGVQDWGNNEQQYYRKDNMQVADGNLVIEARKETFSGKPYTSGRVFTQPTFTKAYGRFEARMQLPTGEGIWPAFWMMPAGNEYGTWASSGEIDIMEARGRLPGEVAGTIHWGKPAPSNKSTGSDYHFPQGQSIAGYHTYAVEWEPGEIRWYVDGNLFHTVNDWSSTGAGQPDKYAYPAPFDKPFYMILNLAIGGVFDGNRLPADSMLPATMKVDYVRVYELTGRPYKTPVEPVVIKENFPANGKPAVNGNLIYDNTYQHGLKDIAAAGTPLDPTYWSFLHTPDFGGAGSASVEQLGGVPYAKLNVTNGGTVPYALQMIQYATLTKGHTYKLSFDAKASAARAINLKMGGDDDNGWAVYSDNFESSLKTDVQHYEYRFTMNGTTDPAARLEFNLGLGTGTVWIGNVVLEETDFLSDPTGNKTPLDNGNHIYNGTFDLGTMDRMKYWNFNVTPDASATASVDADRRQLDAVIADGGSNAASITLAQTGLELLQNDEYKLAFDAKASAVRTIGVKLTNADGTVVFAEDNGVALGTTLASHTLTFEMPVGASYADAKLTFLLGGSDKAVSMDNVKLIRTTNRNVDFTGIDIYPLKNGDFSAGLSSWEPFTQGGAASFQPDNGAAKIGVTNVGGEGWNVMFNQSNLKLVKGLTYEFSFKAKSSVARDIQATLENATYTRRFDTGTLALTPNWQTFSYTFKMAGDDNVALKFLLGKLANSQAGDVFIDDVVLQVQNAPVARPVTLVADATNNFVGQPIELTFTSNAAWEAAVQAIIVNGTPLAAGQFAVQPGVLTLNADAFATDRVYAITVKAMGYADTSVNQTLFASDGNHVMNGKFANGTNSWDTWVGEGGVSDFAVVNETAKIDIHYNGGIHPQWNVPVSWSTQLMQSGIQLEAGKTYDLSFRAWSTLDRPILIELGGYNNNQQAGFDLTSDQAKVYHMSIRPNAATIMTLKYLLGNVVNGTSTTPNAPHSIFLDDVLIKEVKSAPVLAADATDNKVGQGIDLTFVDQADWRAGIQSITVDGTPVASNLFTVTSGKISLDASLFTAVKSYTIAITADGYGTVQVTQEIKSAASNVAVGKTVTASSNSQPAGNAIDGNSATRWETGASDPQWISIDLGTIHQLDSVLLNWEGAFGKSYKIQVSTVADPQQDSDWTDVFTETNGNGGLDPISLGGVEGRHIRMYGLTRGTPYGYSLWEFEVYGTSTSTSGGGGTNPGTGGGGTNPGTGGGGTTPPAPGTNLALGKLAVVSSQNPNMTATNLTDGNNGTRWEPDLTVSNTAEEWAYVDLGSQQTLTTLKLLWEAAYGKVVLIQVADAGSNLAADSTDWRTVQTLNRELTAATFAETIDLGGVQGQYVRVYVTEKGFKPYGPSLFEIEVY
ncbi:carbohydrate binding domain-containing protein [Paenibacillus sp. MMS18-CY102]|uniref:carbohydrate binding domain-containing protein n=1 Tax=Paenibacillus sp. MMS18-CY102 TaxID=2682849 RepID=UPI001365FBA0|nr:carbohydrate binding domain-containing protein [Paenibacillus sp. MMS18-CY102]MWC26895.1 family 16 glycosylhydrolase [Paenibacillus sp. MMS18-CY102]